MIGADQLSIQEQRARVIKIARQWVDLPYVDGARLRNIAGDCTFIALVYEDAGLVPHVDIPSYTPQAHLHRSGALYIERVRRYAKETASPKPGDVVMYWVGRDFSHGGIVIDPGWPHIIHADKMAGRIVYAIGDQGHLAPFKRIYFTLWDDL